MVVKDGADKDPLGKAERKLTKAQMALSVAQEEHAQARVRGKQEVEQARLRAAKWLTKTGKRVDRRAATVSKAEERLAQLQAAEAELQIADVAPMSDPEVDGALRVREQHALDALQSVNGGAGATAGEWQAAAGMSEATFLRARKELLQRGLIARDGNSRRGARYTVRGTDVR